jgi:molybdenum cofactor guanylyltransferase
MKLLGAILAGGQSRRFGSDKAQALLQGKALLDHVIDALLPQVDTLVIIGRTWRELATIADHPQAGGGPLFGLCASLRHGAIEGFDKVLTAGCDVLPIPAQLRDDLAGDGAAIIAGQPLLGLWPTSLAPALEAHILSQADHSLRGWCAACLARHVESRSALYNMNTSADLDGYLSAQA